MPELSVIVPTYNERSNVAAVVQALERALEGIAYEVIFVDDDSPDGTAAAIRALAQTDPRVRIVHRVGRRGLSSAVIEGFLASSAPYLAVIDGDLQHDETLLPAMLGKLKQESLDVVVGTRHAAGGGMGEFSRERVALSNLGKWLSHAACGAALSDPMSGFFLLDRRYFNQVARDLSGVGFKILVDLMASSRRPVRVGEVSYTFRNRLSGESKLDVVVGLEYFTLLVDKLVGRWVPVNYVLFSLVGTVGLLAYLALMAALRGFWEFDRAQVAASSLVIVLNFLLNNVVTFRNRRLHGYRLLAGAAVYFVCCLGGLYANVWIADALRRAGVHWILASSVGLLTGSLWNYFISTLFVWRIRRAGRGPLAEANARTATTRLTHT